MKKFIPILTLIGTSSLIVGIDAKASTNKIDYSTNIKDFKQAFASYNQTNPENVTKTVANYKLEVIDDNSTENNNIATIDDTITNINDTDLLQENSNVENNDNLNNSSEIDTTTESNNTTTENSTDNSINENTSLNEEQAQISTLYSLANDIEDSCNEFCELKTKILNAIAESENLSEQLRNNELTLTREQRLFVNEQSNQLKNLAKQLSMATNELSFNLSDLNAIMKENNQDLNNLSLKYLIVLDSLINGNEMLQNGLGSLNLINNMMQINAKNLPPNNNGRILYGFSENGNKPILKEYTVDENGELTGKVIEENQQTDKQNKSNIDSYKNSILAPNIDSYANNRRNIDSFFNTAWLDNDFMFGANNQFGRGYTNNMYNPNLYQYENYEKSNQANENSNLNNINNSTKDVKQNKKFKLKSNIDTYRDSNTPDIKTKIKNFKASVDNFFKLKTEPKNKIIAPIFKFED